MNLPFLHKSTSGLLSPESPNVQNMPLLGSPTPQEEPFLKPAPGLLRPSARPIGDLNRMLAYNETRGIQDPYGFKQFSGDKAIGDALGKYQISSARLREKGKDFLGRDVSDEEFRSNPKLQDTFITAQNMWLRAHGLTDEQILAVHRGGWGDLSKAYLDRVLKERAQYVKEGLSN